MNALLLSPILIPLLTALLCFTFWKHVSMQRALSLVSAFGLVAAAVALLWHVAAEGPASTQSGGWDAPFGITFVADTFSAIMVLLNALTGFAAIVYSLGSIDPRRERNGYHGLMQALICACSGAFLTGDLFNMYVWFEIMLMSSFVLLALGGERGQLEGGIKYVTLNMLSSVIFLAALGLLYGLVGTLNIADMSVKLETVDNAPMVTAVAMLFLIAFGIKAAAFPFFFWLPASYHTPPAVVSALFAGLLTKVGVYSIIRVFTLVFNQETAISATLVSAIAALTMVTGVLGAAAQHDIRRILSFHIVSQIGYMLMGLGVSGAAMVKAREFAPGTIDHETLTAAAAISLAGSVFYILHHIIVKANLFLVAGIVERIKGSGDLNKIGGLYKDHPYLAILFMIPAMSLAGIPILSGFWSKLFLIVGGVRAETFGIVFVALLVGLLTLFSMTKIWAQAFWKPQPDHDPDEDPLAPDPEPVDPDDAPRGHIGFQYGAVAFMAAITVAIGLGSGPAFRLAEHAASELMTGDDYVRAVLGPNDAPDPAAGDLARASRYFELDESGRLIQPAETIADATEGATE